MVLNSGPYPWENPNYNFHYFPTFTLIWATFFKIFGVANWVSRFFAMVFSLGSVIVFYKLVANFFSRRTAVMASLLWITTPMFIYFGKMPVHEIPLMFFVLGTFYFYFNNRYRLMWAFLLMAELITWSGFFLVPGITIHWWLTGRRDRREFNWKKILALWVVSILLFLLHLTHDYLVTGSPIGGGLGEIFLSRIQEVAIVPYLSVLTRWAVTYYTFLLPLSLFWLVFKRKMTKHQDIPLLFLIYALFYPLVFRDASIRHDYLLIYFWPFLALSSALLVKRYLFVVIIVALMLVLRWKFILALENSDIYKESVRFGQFIHDNSSPAEKVKVVTADSSVPWDGWYIGYYSDRAIVDENADKIFYYLPGGKMRIGVDARSSGTK